MKDSKTNCIILFNIRHVYYLFTCRMHTRREKRRTNNSTEVLKKTDIQYQGHASISHLILIPGDNAESHIHCLESQAMILTS